VVDDWFISADHVRQPMLDANATVAWQPPQYGKRMAECLRNRGDWNFSRKRSFGLPLPFYPCECGVLNVVGSRAELEERATAGPRRPAGPPPPSVRGRETRRRARRARD